MTNKIQFHRIPSCDETDVYVNNRVQARIRGLRRGFRGGKIEEYAILRGATGGSVAFYSAKQHGSTRKAYTAAANALSDYFEEHAALPRSVAHPFLAGAHIR